MRTHACTTGTSIAPRGLRLDETGEASYRQAIRDRIAGLRAEHADDASFFRAASAESNSLRAAGARPGETVLLLHTETLDGRCCADEVARLLEKEAALKPELRKIEGLQVTDSRRFRRVGVQQLFATLDALRQDHGLAAGDELILNATGGFKSMVAFLVLYGVLHRLPVVYLFERSDELLRLPAVPLQFDFDRVARAHDALALLERDGAVHREQFLAKIRGLAHHEREWFECLLEEEDGLVTASAFAQLLQAARSAETASVELSEPARRAWESSEGVQRQALSFLLERVADPLWRSMHGHAFHGTELSVYKPGRTACRLAGYLDGGRFRVCELFTSHQDYERRLKNRKRSDYPADCFTSWSPPPGEPAPATESELIESLAAELAQLRGECERLRSQLPCCAPDAPA